MKKTIIISAIGVSLLAMSMPFIASADENSDVTVRIEGINECLYYGTYELSESKTVADVLSSIDEADDSISITGISDGYITAVNDDKAAHFGGWDGWLYLVNDVEPTVSVSEYTVKGGDSIVLYYGDPYGVGMQRPVADTSEISKGIIKFTSKDAEYDADYNVTYNVNPVADMTVTWESDGKTTEIVTDENGQITVPSDFLTKGSHRLSVSKVSESGIPLVLRLAPDFEVQVDEIIAAETTAVSTTTSTETTTAATTAALTETKNVSSTAKSTTKAASAKNSSPKTSDTMPVVGLFGLTAALTALMARKKND